MKCENKEILFFISGQEKLSCVVKYLTPPLLSPINNDCSLRITKIILFKIKINIHCQPVANVVFGHLFPSLYTLVVVVVVVVVE